MSEIGYGAWQLCNSDSWGGMDDQTALRLIDEAIDGGINLFDTAPNYADTKSERRGRSGTMAPVYVRQNMCNSE